MKKGDIIVGKISKMYHPSDCVIEVEGKEVIVKKELIGRVIECRINKKKNDKIYACKTRLIEESNLFSSELSCEHKDCGGCMFQGVEYENQLKIKEEALKRELDRIVDYNYIWEGLIGAPNNLYYRNKMEYTFGDEFKGGELALGLHKKNNFYDIVNTNNCKIVDDDFNIVVRETRKYFYENNINFYHKMSHKGILRHLLVRRSFFEKEMLVMLSCSELDFVDLNSESYNDFMKIIEGWKDYILSLSNLKAKISGIIYSVNNSLSDAIKEDYNKILFGRDYIYENLCGLKFKISKFSFFQTNSEGAQALYNKIGEYIGDTKDKIVFDLYSGTGTISQIVAAYAKKVYSIEIVKEAVDSAIENAKLNNIDNCEFICGDVLKNIDKLEDISPDYIILDPPRDGINAKALNKIINNYSPEKFIYIACKPTSFLRDYPVFEEKGYKIIKSCAVDMFAGTPNLEMVTLLSK